MKCCLRRETRQRVSILNLRLNRDRAFLHPIKEDIEPTMVDVNGLIAKTIMYHQLASPEIGGDGSATHSINPELAMRQFHARDPRRLRHVDGVFPCSAAIGKVGTRRRC